MNPYLNQSNINYIEGLLTQYQSNPDALDPTWRYFFDGMSFAETSQSGTGSKKQIQADELEFEFKVLKLIQAYRDMAYLIADVNPLDRQPKEHPYLEFTRFGLKNTDLDRVPYVGKSLGLANATLKEIISVLRSYYCAPVAVEMEHIEDPEILEWVQQRVQSKFLLKPLDRNYKQRTLAKLAEAEFFETFLHRRFVGQKRFSLEGSDVLTPMLDYLIDQSANLGCDEVILGMAHRGRLNVLANIFQKDLTAMFAEFSGNVQTEAIPGDGDVKYHKGFSLDTKTFSGKDVHISLSPNPSHLEAVNSVVVGMVRSKQQLKKDTDFNSTWAVLLHGDAAFAGQGNVYETLNLSTLKGYCIGGTIHIIINNQIGFTTEPEDARSTKNPTDVAKMLQVPIFRVNADEPEVALRCIELAVAFRHQFKRDVFIEVVGYRRYGHNEGDEPAFTQPQMYDKIKNHPTVFKSYSDKIIQEKQITPEQLDEILNNLNKKYENALEKAKQGKHSAKMDAFGKRWVKLRPVPIDESIFTKIDTTVPVATLKDLGNQLVQTPADFNTHPKIIRLLTERREMIDEKRPLDWGMGEALAYASILKNGYDIRLAGQDAKRGTFSHRHAVLFDTKNNSSYTPLCQLKDIKNNFEVVNSSLSEYAALGFEFGQSSADPFKLSLWEAQFGDFVNGAQIIIDQFITSSAIKWQRFSGLVMLLPHGYEGQGPEHSSSRFERFLQACAQHNIQVCNLTTPAQFFHVLRRQSLRDYRLPLIITTPKSLLRLPQAVSSLNELAEGQFQEIIDETNQSQRTKAKKLILCSGKIYYEIIKERDVLKDTPVPVIRIEQFYPFAQNKFLDILAQYKNIKEIVWCQEEPENMGGWWFMRNNLLPLIGAKVKLSYAGRLPQASPSDGYMHLHHEQQLKIVRKALG